MFQTQKLDRGWNFRRLGPSGEPEPWSAVDLPHSAVRVDLDGHGHWFGLCEYRRLVQAPASSPGFSHRLYVGAAMHSCVVRLDGHELGRHAGGYLPFELSFGGLLDDGRPHELVLILDNRDNPDVPPGKPFAELDFCWYGGLYRDLELRSYPPVHVTEPVSTGGGVFVRTLRADAELAVLSVRTQARNEGGEARKLCVCVELGAGGKLVVTQRGRPALLSPGASVDFDQELQVPRPELWSPASPSLYSLRVTLRDEKGEVMDERILRVGIRRIAFSRSGGLVINGQTLRLRGANRHQEYPYLGYALPRSAQYRDAKAIKEAGFDYVRLSHYPQSPDFLDACDELGVVVMNAIPGWQFLGGERFREACVREARELVRRDRNHPCVVLWELSLNETDMPEEFMARLHKAGHDEYPGDQFFTCGWMDRFDVYIRSRQHGELHTWSNGDKALVVAEYGDWEYYASNHGFDQKTGAGLHPAWSNSRKLRADGEKGLLQQAANHLEALNDTLSSPAVLDGLWTVFDYARGYHPQRASTGVMDVFRLPKFSYYFYRSQRDPRERGRGWSGGPMVFIASHWTPASNPRVLVFSNCERVELLLNGKSLGQQTPLFAEGTRHLPHPPFLFELGQFQAGRLEALGFVGSELCARHAVNTPGTVSRLDLSVAWKGLKAGPEDPELVFVHARLLDAGGTLCVEDTRLVSLEAAGAEIVGPARMPAEAGVASFLLRLQAGIELPPLRALADGVPAAVLTHARD